MDDAVLKILGKGGGVLKVPSESVQLPAQDYCTGVFLEVCEHSAEFGPSWLFGGLGLLVYSPYFKTFLMGKGGEFRYLRLDR